MAYSEKWRVFCAIEIPAAVRRAIDKHIEQLKVAVPDASVSWTRPENAHLTLKFLGSISASDVAKLSAAAERAVSGVHSFQVTAAGAGSFPAHGQPRVLWVGLQDLGGKLGELQNRLDDEAFREGFARDGRAFHPHLTVGRLRKSHHARTIAAAHKGVGFQAMDIEVGELLVMRSQLNPAGSKYTVISRHKLT